MATRRFIAEQVTEKVVHGTWRQNARGLGEPYALGLDSNEQNLLRVRAYSPAREDESVKSPTNRAKPEWLIRSIGGSLGLCCWVLSALAVANGSLSGTVRDPTGGLIQGATITLVNVALKSTYTTASNVQGYYSFPTLPVGRYSMTVPRQ